SKVTPTTTLTTSAIIDGTVFQAYAWAAPRPAPGTETRRPGVLATAMTRAVRYWAGDTASVRAPPPTPSTSARPSCHRRPHLSTAPALSTSPRPSCSAANCCIPTATPVVVTTFATVSSHIA